MGRGTLGGSAPQTPCQGTCPLDPFLSLTGEGSKVVDMDWFVIIFMKQYAMVYRCGLEQSVSKLFHPRHCEERTNRLSATGFRDAAIQRQ